MIYTIQFINSVKGSFKNKIGELEEFMKIYKTLMVGNDNIKNYHYDIIDKHGKKNKKHLFNTMNDMNKINMSIKVILNKITDKNADILVESLLCEINKAHDVEILRILSNEIINKIIFEKNYQDIYINLCNKLWSIKRWQEKLINIFINDQNKFYWYPNHQLIENVKDISLDTQMNGPFNNEQEAYNDAWKQYNFRATFLNALQAKFEERDKYIELCKGDIDDEVRYKYRRNIFGVIEFIGKMFNKHYINESLLHVVLIKLLHMNDDQDNNNESESTPINEEDIESFCIIWNIIDDKGRPFDVKLIKQYFTHIIEKIMKIKWIMRLQFMLEDLIDKYKIKYDKTVQIVPATNTETNSNSSSQKYVIRRKRSDNSEQKLEEILDIYISKNNLIETINKLKIMNVDKEHLLEKAQSIKLDNDRLKKLCSGLDF